MVYKTRLAENARQNLGNVIPLATPYVLLVDPSNICNIRCRWCPSGHDALIKNSKRPQKIMEFELFKSIIDNLNQFGTAIKVLRLYKEGEPLLNPKFPEMVSYAKHSGYVNRIDTTTNGVLLNPELNQKIIDAGIDQINISVNGVTAKQLLKNVRRNIDFETYISNIKDLFNKRRNCTLYIKSIRDVLSEREQALFLEMFSKYADRVYLERLSPAWPDFSIKDNSGYEYDEIGNYGQPVEDRSVCPYLFYIMVINSDGTVSTCVGDWKHIQIVGDVRVNSVFNIWHGEPLKKYWVKHCAGEKDCFPMCNNCKVITHGCYDNIDSYAENVLRRLGEAVADV